MNPQTALQFLVEGRTEAAAELCSRLLRDHPEDPGANHVQGLVLLQTGKAGESIPFLEKAAAGIPGDAHFRYNLGLALQKAGRTAEAVSVYEALVSIFPDFFEAIDNLGTLHHALGESGRAAALHERALRLRPDHPGALCNLGLALQEMGDPEGAISCFSRALARHPQNPEALNNLGLALQETGRFQEAVAFFLEALKSRPDYPRAKFNLSLLLLLLGRYEEGFELYESRFEGAKELSGCGREYRVLPSWKGEALDGRKILVWTEQGLGDALMMLRFLPMMKGEVSVACGPELGRLIGAFPGVAPDGRDVPEGDFQIPLMSLPRLFGTRIDSIPRQTPYLHVPEPMIREWAEKLSGRDGMKVGLVWAGSPKLRADSLRSLPFSKLAPFLAIPSVRFFSLQKGPAAGEGQGVEDRMGECSDFLDTAALVANLDLVIGVDTSVIHLAGALGKPVWLLNRHGSEWRWMLDREDSPWYPTMRIFRQRSPGDWDEVISRAAAELRKLSSTPA